VHQQIVQCVLVVEFLQLTAACTAVTSLTLVVDAAYTAVTSLTLVVDAACTAVTSLTLVTRVSLNHRL